MILTPSNHKITYVLHAMCAKTYAWLFKQMKECLIKLTKYHTVVDWYLKFQSKSLRDTDPSPKLSMTRMLLCRSRSFKVNLHHIFDIIMVNSLYSTDLLIRNLFTGRYWILMIPRDRKKRMGVFSVKIALIWYFCCICVLNLDSDLILD